VEHIKEDSKSGVLAIRLKDEPVLVDVEVQVCSGGAVNVYFPRDGPEEEIIRHILKILSEANGTPIKVLRTRTDVECQIKSARVFSRDFLLLHSKELVFTQNELEQKFDLMTPGCQIDSLAFQVNTHKYLLSHLKTGYSEFSAALERYRVLMKKNNYPDSRGNPRDVIVEMGPLGPIKAWDDSNKKGSHSASEKDLKEIAELKKRLMKNFFKILKDVEDGLPLAGSCKRCESR
jgi:hypothetical protein